jgi:hypothetical protein
VRRPRYLSVALAAALLLGAGCWTEGCHRLAFYRGERDNGAAEATATLKDDAARARAEALYRRFEEVSDADRRRAIPLAAATFVLGAALLALGARGLSGRSNARSALVQVVAAQAAVGVAAYVALINVTRAEMAWRVAVASSHSALIDRYASHIERLYAPGMIVLRTLASVLIVVALTRAKSRAFFEAAADTVSER